MKWELVVIECWLKKRLNEGVLGMVSMVRPPFI